MADYLKVAITGVSLPVDSRYSHHLGMVHKTFDQFRGIGIYPINAAMTLMDSQVVTVNATNEFEHGGTPVPWNLWGGVKTAHEIGHNVVNWHVRCKGTSDEHWPWFEDYPHPFPNCQLANNDAKGYFGFDVFFDNFHNVSEPQVISNDPNESYPHRAFPLMGYLSPRWIDPYTYCRMLTERGVACKWQDIKD